MKEVDSPKILFENLDLTPIHSTLWTDLHKTELMKIMNAKDQDAVIRALPKSTRRTMRNNRIVKDWRITAGAEKYLVSV
jgi:hypothetical protein